VEGEIIGSELTRCMCNLPIENWEKKKEKERISVYIGARTKNFTSIFPFPNLRKYLIKIRLIL
jgi:hypothetical protein